MLLVAVVDSSLSDNRKLAVVFKLITAIWMVLEVLEHTELVRDEFVADNLFPHIIIAHVSVVQIAAASQTVPKDEIDWSHGHEDDMVQKVEDQVNVKIGRTFWHQTNLKLIVFVDFPFPSFPLFRYVSNGDNAKTKSGYGLKAAKFVTNISVNAAIF